MTAGPRTCSVPKLLDRRHSESLKLTGGVYVIGSSGLLAAPASPQTYLLPLLSPSPARFACTSGSKVLNAFYNILDLKAVSLRIDLCGRDWGANGHSAEFDKKRADAGPRPEFERFRFGQRINHI